MWLSIDQAAEYIAVSKPTIREWMTDGLRHARVGERIVRIKQEWVDEYIEAHEEQLNLGGLRL